MNETQYGIIEVKSDLPPRRLLRVPHQGKVLTLGYPVFGPNFFSKNVAEMQRQYAHPLTGEAISFKEPTTSESISASAYKFTEMTKPQIFDQRWLQIGKIVRTSDGVYVNVPKQALNGDEADEKMLKSFLNEVKPCKVGRGNIYLVPNSEALRDFGFAEYATFSKGVQDAKTFTEGGLAKILEHAEEAQNLSVIADAKNYSKGVNVFGFDEVSSPVVRVASLDSHMVLGCDGFGVYGGWSGGNDGYVFGVLDLWI